MLDITLLSAFSVRSASGSDLTPSGSRERAALALLAIAAPDTVSTERLASELYGEVGGPDPRNAVQATISRLRKALGRSAGSLETHGGGYRLVDIRLDSDIAEAKLADAHALTGEDKLACLDEALAIWGEQSLDTMGPSAALEAENFRLSEIRAAAEDTRLELRFALGLSDATLISELEAATREQPLREGRWALLMRSLYLADRQADALRAFQRARHMLGDQLGLEPGPALVALEQQILNHDPALASAEPAPVLAPGRPMPSGTVTVLLCDVEGSVHQWESEPDTTAQQIADLHSIWSDAVATHDGVLVKSTGDGILAVFDTAADALHASVDGQRAHHERGGLKVRVAANTGPCTPVDGDYRGPLVNRCARLLELTAGNQILIAGTTAELAGDGLASEVGLRSLGSHWLRDVPKPVDVVQVTAPGIPSDFGDIRSIGPADLPRLRNEMLGRDQLSSEIISSADSTPLITLLGPGGIGKTTLALAVAWEISVVRRVCFVDLAAITDPSAVARHVADAVGQSDDSRSPSRRLKDRLRANTDLVVLDNAEHVLDAVAELLDGVLTVELKGSFIVTSRHPLAIAGEQVVVVPPLLLPDENADLLNTAKAPSVALFLSRLHDANQQRPLPPGLLPVVAHICRRLDGIPLAIELAAGRASVLAIDDIAARLDDQLRLLRQVPARRERRHRSLEAVVGWSLEQLEPGSRDLFRLLSVFAGDFAVPGVERVMHHFGLNPADAIDQLSELTAASLVSVESNHRFRLLEPVRQVAAAELESTGSIREAHWAHARWICDMLGEAFAEASQGRSEQLRAADLETDEIQAATSRTADHGFHDVVVDLAVPGGYWFVSRNPGRGSELWAKIAASIDPTTDEIPFALAVTGWCTSSASYTASPPLDDVHLALATLQRAEHPALGLASIVASYAFTQSGDLATARMFLEQADRLISSDNEWARAILEMSYAAVTSLAIMTKQPTPYEVEAAERRGDRAAVTLRRLDDRWALGVALGELGRLKQYRGDVEGAERCLLESFQLLDSSEFHGIHYILSEIAKLASRRGEHEAAAEYHRQAMSIVESDGGSTCMALTLGALAESAEHKGAIDEAIEYYERALIMEANDAESGTPGHWQDNIERLLAMQQR